MRTYKLSSKDRPMTRVQMINYCSKFYKRAEVIKLIDTVVSKFTDLQEEAMLAGKVKIFYANEVITVMTLISPDFDAHKEAYEEEVRKKLESVKTPSMKLLSMIFGGIQ